MRNQSVYSIFWDILKESKSKSFYTPKNDIMKACPFLSYENKKMWINHFYLIMHQHLFRSYFILFISLSVDSQTCLA